MVNETRFTIDELPEEGVMVEVYVSSWDEWWIGSRLGDLWDLGEDCFVPVHKYNKWREFAG